MDASSLLATVDSAVAAADLDAALAATLEHFGADSGTIHFLHADGLLHLAACSAGIPDGVLAAIQTIPVGKGMAGLAVQRREPVTACNLQTDTTGDVRPGARATGLQGSIVVPVARDGSIVGSFGIANRQPRTFTEDETALLRQVADRVSAVAPR